MQSTFVPGTRRLARTGVFQRTTPSRLVVLAKESRVGNKSIPVPKGVEVTINGNSIKVKGPLGTLERTLVPDVSVEKAADGKIVIKRLTDNKASRAMHGLSRALVNNMVTGTATGFTINLELQGTGFRASTTAKELTLNLGYSNPRVLPIPAGVKVAVEKGTNLSISGPDKQVVGQFCAIIRAQRSPDPYLGKGVRFAGEVIKLKEGKAAGKK